MQMVQIEQENNFIVWIQQMTNFYNRYRSLFALDNYTPPKHQSFLDKKSLFLSQPQSYFSRKNASVSSQSPALDQFRKQILPKLKQPYPQIKPIKLKYQTRDNNKRLKQSIFRQQTPIFNARNMPLQLNKNKSDLYVNQQQQNASRSRVRKPKMRLETEPPSVQVDGSYDEMKLKFSRHMEALQQLYMKGTRVNQNTPQKSQIIHKQYNLYTQKEQKAQNRYEQQMFQQALQTIKFRKKMPFSLKSNIPKRAQYAKRWQVKTLPRVVRSLTEHQSSLNPQLPSHFDLLMGLQENQYAFVHSRLDDIKRIQKFMPRGIINTYRECLIRRKESKEDLEARRKRLKNLLLQQQS